MAQNYTDNCFDPNNVLQTDLQALENNFAALKSQFSGASGPANPVAGMPWVDLTRHMLCVRNEANNAWMDIFNLATGQAVGIPTASGSTLGGVKVGARLSIADGVLSADTQSNAPPDGSVTGAKLVQYTAGPYTIIEDTRGVTPATTTYEKTHEILIPAGGVLRVEIIGEADVNGLYLRVYRNGTAVGTERYCTGFTTYSEDIAGWSPGDLVQLYARRAYPAWPQGVGGIRIKSALHLTAIKTMI